MKLLNKGASIVISMLDLPVKRSSFSSVISETSIIKSSPFFFRKD